MSAPDYLWPARPEYLRRGTPVCVGSDGSGADVVVTVWPGGGTVDLACRPGLSALACLLDLRDVTARAHAAMAYTVVRALGSYGGEPPPMWSVVATRGLAYQPRIADILCRMRMLDGSVTVAEAREALGRAELVAGVIDGT